MKAALRDLINSSDVKRAFTDLVFSAIQTLLARADANNATKSDEDKKED